MIDPAVHNQNLVRAAVAVAAVAAAAKATEFLPSHLVSFVHLVSLSTWLGTTVYTTLVIGIVLFKQLPRQTFGRVQSKARKQSFVWPHQRLWRRVPCPHLLTRSPPQLFPIYFGVSAACILLCLGTSFASGHMARMPVLLTALVSTLANLFLLEPVTTSVMYKIYDMENTDRKQTDEYKAARKKFGGLHGASSLVNLVGMVCAIMHCYALSVAMA